MSAVIELRDVEKTYRIGAERINLRAAMPGPLGRRGPDGGHAALAGVSFDVSPGESLGVIGSNGAGKSTLLKLLARVIAPTRGSIVTRGSVASLIELGASFHPDLTGRENIRFAAALRGIRPQQASRHYEEIIDFAGIPRFMDTPVKRYSTGMLARLGFAVAALLEADILAVDEVLSVGDAAFQAKCHAHMMKLRDSGSALLFVTHNLWVIPQVCDRALRLENGRVVDEGSPEEVVARYRARSADQPAATQQVQTEAARLDLVSAYPPAIRPGEGISVKLTIRTAQALPDGELLVSVGRPDGLVCTTVKVREAGDALARPGSWTFEGEIESLPLLPGHYTLYISIVSGPVVHDQVALELAVIGEALPASTFGVFGVSSDWTFHDEHLSSGGARQ